MVPLGFALNIILGLTLLIGSIVWSADYWSAANRPPLKYLSMSVLNKGMQPGERLYGRVTFDRRRNCPGTTMRSITKIDTDGDTVVVYRDPIPVTHVITELGESISLKFFMELPKLPSGPYQLGGNVRVDCNGKIFTMELPITGFNIVDGSPP